MNRLKLINRAGDIRKQNFLLLLMGLQASLECAQLGLGFFRIRVGERGIFLLYAARLLCIQTIAG